MNLIDKLNKLREREGLNKGDLAALLQVTPSYLSQIYSGRPSDRVEMLVDRLLNQIVLPERLRMWVESEAKRRELKSGNDFVAYLVMRERDAANPPKEKAAPSETADVNPALGIKYGQKKANSPEQERARKKSRAEVPSERQNRQK